MPREDIGPIAAGSHEGVKDDLKIRAESLQRRMAEMLAARKAILDSKLKTDEDNVEALKTIHASIGEAQTILSGLERSIDAYRVAGLEISLEITTAQQEAQEFIADLEKQAQSLEQESKLIYGEEGVQDKMVERAEEEEKERNQKKLEQDLSAEIARGVVEIELAMDIFNSQSNTDKKEINRLLGLWNDVSGQERDVELKTHRNLGINLRALWDEQVEHGAEDPAREVRQALEEQKSELGLFEGKRKKLFTEAIAGFSVFADSRKAQKAYSEMHKLVYSSNEYSPIITIKDKVDEVVTKIIDSEVSSEVKSALKSKLLENFLKAIFDNDNDRRLKEIYDQLRSVNV